MRHQVYRLVLLGALACLGSQGMSAPENAVKVLEIESSAQKSISPIDVGSLNRLGVAALSGSPGRLGTFLPAFDRRLDQIYEAQDAGPATLEIHLRKPQRLHALRLLPGDGRYEWSVAAADTPEDLRRAAGSFRYLVQTRERIATGAWDEEKLREPVDVTALLLKVTPPDPGQRVVIREFNLVAEQSLEAIFLESPTRALPLGEMVPLTVMGYFSGGETRPITARRLSWTVQPSTAARMLKHQRITGKLKGPVDVSVRLDKLISPPLPLEVVDAD